MRMCPNCRQPVEDDRAYCPSCLSPLTHSPNSVAACRFCGSPLDPVTKRCTGCKRREDTFTDRTGPGSVPAGRTVWNGVPKPASAAPGQAEDSFQKALRRPIPVPEQPEQGAGIQRKYPNWLPILLTFVGVAVLVTTLFFLIPRFRKAHSTGKEETESRLTLADDGDSEESSPDVTAASASDTSDTPIVSKAPVTKEEIVDFYKKAVDMVRNDAAGGFSRKEWQTIAPVNVTGVDTVDDAIMNLLKSYFKDEATAETTVSAKGSADAKNRMNGFTLDDDSKLISATCNEVGGSYRITLVLAEEDTPHDGQSFLQKAGSVLGWEDVEKELKSVSILNGYEDVHIRYKNYTITATISPKGHFSALKHHCDVSVDVGSAKIMVLTLTDSHLTMESTVLYTNWKY